MRVIIKDTAADVAVEAAAIIADTVRAHSPVSLGLATGSTPLDTYRQLIRMHKDEGLSFAHASVYMLDEYVGISREDENSYYRTIRREFSEHVDIDDSRVFSPNGQAEDLDAEVIRYEKLVRDANVELQLLGIGADGHIGFNEPGSAFDSPTQRVILHPRTIEDNARFFESKDEVPVEALSQGLATIRASQHPVLLATGENKAPAIAATVEGAISTSCPASILQFHPNCTIIVDEAAASQLTNTEYYKFADAHRRRR